MKIRKLLLSFVLLFSVFYGKTQIVVDCDNERVGIGFGLTTPSYDIDMYGRLKLTLPNSANFTISSLTSGLGSWGLKPNINGAGHLGYGRRLYKVNATYVYGDVVTESDRKLKRNINQLNNATPILNSLRAVSFDYIDDYAEIEDAGLRNKLETNNKNRLGFIAQEVQEILPQSVMTKEVDDETLGIRMMDFIPLLVKGFQEQQVQIDSLVDVINKSDNLIKSAQIGGININSNSEAKLEQNNPNPFSEQTIINCFIPTNSNNASLLVFNMQGTLVKSYNIPGRNETSVAIAGAELNAGMYIYSLVIDNKEIDSKRMILSN